MMETDFLKIIEKKNTANMVFIPGGKFLMGSDEFYPEEKPVHEVTVDSFYMDRYEVTNEDYQKFVDETGYVTIAERPLNPALSPCCAATADDRYRHESYRVQMYCSQYVS